MHNAESQHLTCERPAFGRAIVRQPAVDGAPRRDQGAGLHNGNVAALIRAGGGTRRGARSARSNSPTDLTSPAPKLPASRAARPPSVGGCAGEGAWSAPNETGATAGSWGQFSPPGVPQFLAISKAAAIREMLLLTMSFDAIIFFFDQTFAAK